MLHYRKKYLRTAISEDDLQEGKAFWVKNKHVYEELPSVELEWPENGYRLKAVPTGRIITLLEGGEFTRLKEFSLVGLFDDEDNSEYYSPEY